MPERAIQPGQDGPFVFVVNEGRARVKNVDVDRQVGEQVVVAKGLAGDEQVIIDVPPTLANNSPVLLATDTDEGGSRKGKGSGKGKGKSKPAVDAAGPDADQPRSHNSAKAQEYGR